MRDSTALLDDPAALRSRYCEDGYLLLRGVLDPAPLLALREAYFSRFDREYLSPGTAPADGIFSGTRPPGLPAHGTAGHPAHDFVRDATFLEFASNEALARLAGQVLGAPVRRLPRAILRHFDRHAPMASRAHIDHSYMDAGSDEVVTVWIPIGDCPRPTGGLIYLEGSQHVDRERLAELSSVSDRPHDHRPISHDLSWVAKQIGSRWLWADYKAGDVAIHCPNIVHASLDTTTDLMRLSIDLRYLADGEPADPRWLKDWSGDDGN